MRSNDRTASADLGNAWGSKIPIPTPSDVDVSDSQYMPMDSRLLKSRPWLLAKNWRGEGPGLAFALTNLWLAAFRNLPAGSIEDDNEVLADAAQVPIEHWGPMKEKALRGWERHGGRLWHPVVCELAWELWLKRLAGRHLKTCDSWRGVAKRATDKGIVPPDPPGTFDDWLAIKYPQTAAYLAALTATKKSSATASRAMDGRENPTDFRPKGREGKIIPPIIPRQLPADGPIRGKEGELVATGKAWFAQELARLENEFRPMLRVMLSEMQQPGVAGKFAFVRQFRSCWLQRRQDGNLEIIAKSAQQARTIIAVQGHWIRHYYPDLVVRHARIDELRARNAA